MRRSVAAQPVLLALVLLVAGCGDDDTTSGSAAVGASTSTAVATTTVGSGSAGSSTTVRGSSTTSGGGASGELTDAIEGADLSTVRRALALTGLLDDVGREPVTLFAPEDGAFLKLPAKEIADLLADRDELSALLKRHIARGSLTAEQLARQTSVTTESGDVLPVTSSGGNLTVGGARVLRSGTSSDGAVIVHTIDRVLGEG